MVNNAVWLVLCGMAAMPEEELNPLFPRPVLLHRLDHAFEIGIAGAESPCEPVSAAPDNLLAVGENIKLAGRSRRNDCIYI